MTEIHKLDTIYTPHPHAFIYFGYVNGILVYIGKTRGLSERLKRHEYVFDEARILGVKNSLLERIEKILIIQLKPKHNQRLYRDAMMDFTIDEYQYLKDMNIDTNEFIEFENPNRYCFCSKFHDLKEKDNG